MCLFELVFSILHIGFRPNSPSVPTRADQKDLDVRELGDVYLLIFYMCPNLKWTFTCLGTSSDDSMFPVFKYETDDVTLT